MCSSWYICSLYNYNLNFKSVIPLTTKSHYGDFELSLIEFDTSYVNRNLPNCYNSKFYWNQNIAKLLLKVNC